MLYGGVTSGVVALIPLYASNRYGIDALGSGTLLVAQGAAAIIFSIVATFALRRSGYRMPMYVGGAVTAVGMLLLAPGPLANVSPYVWLAGCAFLDEEVAGQIIPLAVMLDCNSLPIFPRRLLRCEQCAIQSERSLRSRSPPRYSPAPTILVQSKLGNSASWASCSFSSSIDRSRAGIPRRLVASVSA